MLWLYQRTIFGTLDKPENEKLLDLNFREIMTLAPLVVCSFWIGLYPAPFFKILEEPVDRLVQQVNKTHVYPESIVRLNPGNVDPADPEQVARLLEPATAEEETEAR